MNTRGKKWGICSLVLGRKFEEGGLTVVDMRAPSDALSVPFREMRV